MFSFFKKKTTPTAQPPASAPVPERLPLSVEPSLDAAAKSVLAAPQAAAPSHAAAALAAAPPTATSAVEPAAGWWKTAVGKLTGSAAAAVPTAVSAASTPVASPPAVPAVGSSATAVADESVVPPPTSGPGPTPAPAHTAAAAAAAVPFATSLSPVAPAPEALAATPPPATRQRWLDKLRNGLRKTGSNIAQVFTGTQIDEALYEELEAALLMADAGVKATEFLLTDLKRRVKDSKATDPAVVKALLGDALTELLAPLEKSLEIGRHKPLVMMVVGVNGAGKTTSIGKLTRHLADAEQTVLLAAADTFRAAAREQLAVWADRNRVEIISQEGADPAAVAFDAVSAGRARGRDVVIADTAGRLPTQLHLMEELKKIKRVITKAESSAPHEVLLVVDGNTGQNALTQVKAFDDVLGLTGLVITKLDGTAKGGVLAAIALWARERAKTSPDLRPVAVYFIGVGEKLEDLETFNAREFAQALLG